MRRSQLLNYLLAFALLFIVATASVSETTRPTTTDLLASAPRRNIRTAADHIVPVPRRMRWKAKLNSWSAPMRNALPKLAFPTLARLRLAVRDTVVMACNWLNDVYLAPRLELQLLLEAPRTDCPPRDKTFAFDNTISYAIPEDAFATDRLHLHLVLHFAMSLTEHNMVAVRQAMLDHPDPLFAAMRQYGRTEKAIHRAFFYEGLTVLSEPRYRIIDCIRDTIQTDLREKFRDGVQDILVNKCPYAWNMTTCYDAALASLSESLVDVWRHNHRHVTYRASFAHAFLRLLSSSLFVQIQVVMMVYFYWPGIVHLVKALFISPPFWQW